MNYTIDVGNHLFALGALYILLKPILYLLAIGFLFFGLVMIYHKYKSNNDNYFLPTIPPQEPVYRNQIIFIAIGIILFAVLVLG